MHVHIYRERERDTLTGHSTIRENNASCNARAASARPGPRGGGGAGGRRVGGRGGGGAGVGHTTGLLDNIICLCEESGDDEPV
jgi:hypothetical protein